MNSSRDATDERPVASRSAIRDTPAGWTPHKERHRSIRMVPANCRLPVVALASLTYANVNTLLPHSFLHVGRQPTSARHPERFDVVRSIHPSCSRQEKQTQHERWVSVNGSSLVNPPHSCQKPIRAPSRFRPRHVDPFDVPETLFGPPGLPHRHDEKAKQPNIEQSVHAAPRWNIMHNACCHDKKGRLDCQGSTMKKTRKLLASPEI